MGLFDLFKNRIKYRDSEVTYLPGYSHEFCPRCEANITLQKGYRNDLPYWVCKGCGEMLINPEVDGDIGLLMCNGHELTGIGKADRTNVVKVTSQMKAITPDIPEDWYVIENENMDGAAMWQDSKGNVYFNKKKEYSSFIEFLDNM